MVRARIDQQGILPTFVLRGRGGEVFDSVDLKKKKKSLALFLLSQPASSFLAKLEDAVVDMRERGAEVVVVCPCGTDRLEELHRTHRLTSVLLADEERELFNRCLEAATDEPACALFVADRSGTVYFRCAGDGPAALPSWDDIKKAITFVESQYTTPK